MEQPWLDSLSEDWKSQQRSSSPTSLPNGTPAGSVNGVMATSRPKSRIPRLSGGASISSSGTAGSQREKQSLPPKFKHALIERSASDINIPLHSSPFPIDTKPVANYPTSKSTSGASAHSIVRCPNAARDARSSFSAKPRNHKGTPEWKRLVMNAHNGSPGQQDLFSPMGLAGIFHKPTGSPPGQLGKAMNRFSFAHDLESMPSSPPPWPATHRAAELSVRILKGQRPESKLGILEEQEEDEGNTTKRREIIAGGSSSKTSKSDVDNPVRGSHNYSENQQEGRTTHMSQLDGSSDIEHKRHTSKSSQLVSEPRPLSLNGEARTLNPMHLENPIEGGGPRSSSSIGFSPVFISKHNTVDGRVDYAAVDLSNAEVVDQLKRLRVCDTNQDPISSGTTCRKDGPATQSPRTPAGLAQTGSLFSTTEVAALSGFVSVERGGHSDEASFKRRPLIPSVSSSLVPSDSVSQTYGARSNHFGPPSCTTYFDHNGGDPSAAATIPSGSPRTPVARSLVQPPKHKDRSPDRPRSSVSPLKLFGNHDTFTSGRLLSRMTQLNNIESEHEIHKNGSPDRVQISDHYSIGSREVNSSTRASASIETVLHRAHSEPDLKHLSTGFRILPMNHENAAINDKPSSPRDFRTLGRTFQEGTRDNRRSREVGQSQSKRPAPTPFKHSTPKRQRTLGETDIPIVLEHMSVSVQDQHRRMQAVIGQQRKDAGYDSNEDVSDAAEISKRQIIRTRNPTPGQGREEQLYSDYAIDSFISHASRLSVVQEHIEQAQIPSDACDAAQIRALASEVATFRLKSLQGVDGLRKQSVSTQDYVDEAMKIMDLIRSQRKPRSELSSLGDPDETALPYSRVGPVRIITPQTISRPPSREGAISAWRTRGDKGLDSMVLNHLKKFQETGDESFILSSAPRSLEVSQYADTLRNEHGRMESEPPNIRITENSNIRRERRYSDSVLSMSKSEIHTTHSPIKTNSSNPSTDTTGRTIATNSSQRTRTLPVIAPEKVSHLLPPEGAGMRFDAERQVWIRCKTSGSKHPRMEHISSSTGTEDDPFGHIPDLSVNEVEELHRVYSASRSQVLDRDLFGVNVRDKVHLYEAHGPDQGIGPAKHRPTYPTQSDVEPCLGTSSSELKISQFASGAQHVETRTACCDQKELTTRIHSINSTPQRTEPSESLLEECEDDGEVEFLDDEPRARVATDTVRSRRTDVSVLFSSPLVSRDWVPDISSNLQYGGSTNFDLDSSFCDERSLEKYRDQNLNSFSTGRKIVRQGPTLQASLGTYNLTRALSLSRVDERREISIVGIRPNGRSMSLTLSIATPLPAHRSVSVPHVPSSGLRHGLLSSLSTLSEFSVHQDDARHLHAQHLADPNQLNPMNNLGSYALTIGNLVERLTDAEPDEPYWDYMRALTLRQKNLDNVHMLGEFCSRLEELDVAENQLSQLSGAPLSIRQLNAQLNRLTSLTTWGHLANLQHLDVSGNDINSLEGFSGLVHLRELKADDNQIASLEGVLDLDGLISLSLKRNQLKQVDFHGTTLHKLETLFISGNVLLDVYGLGCLPELVTLDCSYNRLLTFPNAEGGSCLAPKLRTLRIQGNDLKQLDIYFFPDLHVLQADGNSLSSINAVSDLEHLHTLSLRDQSSEDLALSINEYSEVRNLSLSGNTISSFPCTTQFLNLQVLELAGTGLQVLPTNFASLAPNLRDLNLNFNALKSLRPLRGITKLKQLMAAGNRLARLRKTLLVIETFKYLERLDLRDNPVSLGFYAPHSSLHLSSSGQQIACVGKHRGLTTRSFDQDDAPRPHLLPSAHVERDRQYAARLDEDTRLRRRVYELLLTTKCTRLESVDGLHLAREEVLRKDDMWERLLGLGVVEMVTGKSERLPVVERLWVDQAV